MPPSNLRPALEALLFSSDQPLTPALLAEALETTVEEVRGVLLALGGDYAARESGVELREIAGGWMFVTCAAQSEWVARMLRGRRKTRLSRAALETMAIVAYKQPVTKSEIEAIRGVDASGVLATLLERNLVTITGRSTVVGRPLLYGTTQEFLNYFGLRELRELPRPEELRALVAAREPEQLEMMELDPGTGMPLAASGAAVSEPLPAYEPRSHEPEYSIADADAAIAQANAARAEAVRAFAAPAAGAGHALAGLGDFTEAGDGPPAGTDSFGLDAAEAESGRDDVADAGEPSPALRAALERDPAPGR